MRRNRIILFLFLIALGVWVIAALLMDQYQNRIDQNHIATDPGGEVIEREPLEWIKMESISDTLFIRNGRCYDKHRQIKIIHGYDSISVNELELIFFLGGHPEYSDGYYIIGIDGKSTLN